jgi:ectoine hydroxylase-related dioxygenase (phytanoyl-CoA dioxygenase family)
MSLVTVDLGGAVREVTPEEVAFYDAHGWVMLRELVSRELCAELLAAGHGVVPPPDEAREGLRARGGLAPEGIEPFRSLVFSCQLALAARALINRGRLSDNDVPIQYHADSLWCKEPSAQGTGYHQDDVVRPGDRAGVFNMWLALDEVTPEMGAMRFLDGVHREGPLGPVWAQSGEDRADGDAMLRYYTKLPELYPWTPPLHYQPGDATVHHAWMVHGGPPNTTDRQRWSYIIEFMPADTQYFFDGDTRRVSRQQQRPLPEESNPIVYR